MSIYKWGDVYWFKFMHEGRLIRRSTEQSNDKGARKIEAKAKSELACGDWGIPERKAAPVLSECLQNEFLPFVENAGTVKASTVSYYRDGSDRLRPSDLAGMRLNEIWDQHTARFVAQNSHFLRLRLTALFAACGAPCFSPQSGVYWTSGHPFR